MRKTYLFLLLAPLVVSPVAAIRRGSVIPNTIYRPSQTSAAVADTRSGTVIDRVAAHDGDDRHARRYITLDEEDEDEDEDVAMSYGALAAAEDVYAHLYRIHRAVGKVFPQTERAHKPMQRVNNLSEVQRSNTQRDPKDRIKLLYLGIDSTAFANDEASYEVVAPAGFQFSKLVGVVVPRTERELQRQVAFMTGRFGSDGGDGDGASDVDTSPVIVVDKRQTQPQRYVMPGEMVDEIRVIRSGVIAKYGGMKRSSTDVGVTKRQSSIGNQVSGRPSACNMDIRQCPMGQAKAFDPVYRFDYRCIAMSGAIAVYTFNNAGTCYICADINGRSTACMDPICINACIADNDS